jgi:lycopene cyclase domain-containing protein
MWGNLTYFISTLIFGGLPVLLEVVFGWYFFKKYLKTIRDIVFIGLLIAPLGEGIALYFKAWQYNPQRNLGITIFYIPLETYVFTILVGLAVTIAIYIWTYYEDCGKPIIKTSLYDMWHGTYAIWRKKSK